MVFFFTTVGGFTAYMGKDKYENDGLIEHGWPEDIWFHVDSYSSAHVYLRLPRGPERKLFRETGRLDHLPEVLAELCALTKANSIEGSKQSSVTVVYTPWENLRKGADMDFGTVGFNDRKAVVKVAHVDKQKELVKRLEKTQIEEYPGDGWLELHAAPVVPNSCRCVPLPPCIQICKVSGAPEISNWRRTRKPRQKTKKLGPRRRQR